MNKIAMCLYQQQYSMSIIRYLLFLMYLHVEIISVTFVLDLIIHAGLKGMCGWNV